MLTILFNPTSFHGYYHCHRYCLSPLFFLSCPLQLFADEGRISLPFSVKKKGVGNIVIRFPPLLNKDTLNAVSILLVTSNTADKINKGNKKILTHMHKNQRVGEKKYYTCTLNWCHRKDVIQFFQIKELVRGRYGNLPFFPPLFSKNLLRPGYCNRSHRNHMEHPAERLPQQQRLVVAGIGSTAATGSAEESTAGY